MNEDVVECIDDNPGYNDFKFIGLIKGKLYRIIKCYPNLHIKCRHCKGKDFVEVNNTKHIWCMHRFRYIKGDQTLTEILNSVKTKENV